MDVKGEITFDALVVEDNDNHVEGCYRLSKGDWKVFYFTHWFNGEVWYGAPIIRKDVIWPSGIQGIDALYPSNVMLNKNSIKKIISEILDLEVEWTEVSGPDSLQLK